MAKNKDKKKKERERRVAQEKLAAQKRAREKSAEAEARAAAPKNVISAVAVPKPPYVAGNKQTPFNNGRMGS